MKNNLLNSIEKFISDKGSVKIEDLCVQFSVSTNTIRRYLIELEQRGNIRKTYGGAIFINLKEYAPEQQREIFENSAKLKIAKMAADLVEDGDVIFLDSGSTVGNMVQFLSSKKNITIVTHSVPVLIQAVNMSNIYLISLGGTHYKNTNSFFSNDLIDKCEQMNFSKLFLGCMGVTIEGGVTNITNYETALKTVVMKKSNNIILMADRTKIGKNAVISLCSLNDLYAFVTDEKPDDNIIRYCKQNNINLIYE